MTENQGHFIEDLEEGMEGSYSRTILEQDISAFAALSGDTNPVHLDEAYAATTMFKGRIAHGLLSAGLISTILGTILPGPGSIYLSQTLKFRAPVRIGERVIATARIVSIDRDQRRVVFECRCAVGETTVIEGEAQVMVPSRPS